MIISEYWKTEANGDRTWRSYSDLGYLIKDINTNEEFGVAIYIEGETKEFEELDGRFPRFNNGNTGTNERLENVEASTDALLGIK